MQKRVEFIEHTTGYVEIDVTDEMSTDEIEDAVLEAIDEGEGVYCDTTHDIKTEDYCDLDFENLFARALTHETDYEDIETAMDSMDITESDIRAKVKKWFHCDTEED
jgi:hypothetical protein